MLYNSDQFPFTNILEQNVETILNEYLTLEQKLLSEWPEIHLYQGAWNVFGIYDFPNGNPLESGIEACPDTAKIVSNAIPRHGAVGFSVLRAGTQIKPHVGYKGNYLRCHLPLIVPEGDCGIAVNNQPVNWSFGKTLIFDDRYEHSAWNFSDKDRVVLLIDFVENNVEGVSSSE